jgi:hypothetical protein
VAKKRGKRFRLLLYERMWQRWAFPCLMLVPASIALWFLVPRISFIPPSLDLPLLDFRIPLRPLIPVPAMAAAVILIYTYLARCTAWVQCRDSHLLIKTPIYPLAISYGRIKAVRPSRLSQIFDPAKERAGRRDWLGPYWGKTALAIETSKYPVDKRWLRLWFNPYLFAPNMVGFVLLVEDWMTLSRQISDYRSDWEARRAAQRQQAAEE